jgi:hypothetical protein
MSILVKRLLSKISVAFLINGLNICVSNFSPFGCDYPRNSLEAKNEEICQVLLWPFIQASDQAVFTLVG